MDMPDHRYIKENKRYRDFGLNTHHHNKAGVQPDRTRHMEREKSPDRHLPKKAQPDTNQHGGSSVTLRLAVQFGVLSIFAHFYVKFFFELFAVFATVPAIAFLTFWGPLLKKRLAPHRSAGSLAFVSGLLLLLLIWIYRLCLPQPTYIYPLIIFNPTELVFRIGDLWADAGPLFMISWILEFFLLTIVPPIRIQRAKQRSAESTSDYNPFDNA